jgi:long-chain acyl-CoA synthetase
LKLKEDLLIVRPTIFVSVPRIYNRLYSAMNQGIQGLAGCKKGLATQAFNTKLNNLKSKCEYTHVIYDSLVFSKTKAALGGRVRYLVTGSAPLGADVLDFMKVAMACPFIEGYGSTESTAASFFTTQIDPNASGIVGGPSVTIEFKVVDVADMNYLSTDRDKDGHSTPRGEICMRGPAIFMGYYKDDAKTREAIDGDGWLHTGDVGVIQTNGALKIVDRSKNIFKLS